MKPELLTIKDLNLDRKFYVRVRGEPWWFTVNKYAEMMKAGAKFPAILVGDFQGILYVVDGWHRVKAVSKNGEAYIRGVRKRYDSEKDMFVDSYRANSDHGLPLTTQDISHVVNRLKDFGLTIPEISSLVRYSVEGLKKLQVRTMDGAKGIKFLKSSTARLLAGGIITEEQAYEMDQSSFSTRSVEDVVVQLIDYLEAGAYPWLEEKFKDYAGRLIQLMQPHLEEAMAE